MTKNDYYFPHDYHAKEDERISHLLSILDWQGYGLYWAIIENLHSSSDGWLDSDCMRIGFALRTHEAIIHQILYDFKLFVHEGGRFTSDRVLRNLEKRHELSDKGRKNAKARWNKVLTNDATAMPLQCKPNARKERKGKEIINTPPKLPADLSTGFQQKAKQAKDKGFNIYQLTNKYLQGKAFTLPESVLERVLDRFLNNGQDVKEIWPYFLAVLADESERHNAGRNEAEGDSHKKQPVSLNEILARAI